MPRKARSPTCGPSRRNDRPQSSSDTVLNGLPTVAGHRVRIRARASALPHLRPGPRLTGPARPVIGLQGRRVALPAARGCRAAPRHSAAHGRAETRADRGGVPRMVTATRPNPQPGATTTRRKQITDEPLPGRASRRSSTPGQRPQRRHVQPGPVRLGWLLQRHRLAMAQQQHREHCPGFLPGTGITAPLLCTIIGSGKQNTILITRITCVKSARE